ncbi:alpha/beta fold hydrolase [Polyangium aurulentum]|uniref:alpha/beta fold hydrolase n=1 Tax=Polyangium aurulentum TaxID=2567896 RepID=UPI001F2AAED2|nr:alpha/beta hydrolase [Polyangium aurulentum]
MTEPFLPFHALVSAPGSTPSRWMLVLHGILGSGGNFRTFARRVAAAHPDWGMVLVDLRAHGQSLDAPPPHTISAAAEDLVRLGSSLGLEVRGVMGHSFGGKVALAYAEKRRGELDEVWVLDASPGTRRDGMASEGAPRVIAVLDTLPETFPSRERFMELLRERGLSRQITDWLAMNVRRADDGFRFRLDLGVIKELLADYFALDLFPILEDPGLARRVHFVLGGRSDTVSASDRAHLVALCAQGPLDMSVDVLDEAGHWLHADDPEGLFAVVSAALSKG